MRHFLGLRSAIYTVEDLAGAKAWYTTVVGKPPYFDEPFYVGFSVGGFELGLLPFEGKESDRPGGDRPSSGTPYWGVEDADAAYARLLELGASPLEPIADHGVKIGAVRDPFGNILGVIENPAFKIEPD